MAQKASRTVFTRKEIPSVVIGRMRNRTEKAAGFSD